MLPLLSAIFEVYSQRRLSGALLDTYLGAQTGMRVLEGKIRRGDGETIHAVIWFSDLRDSTRLTEALGRDAYLALLNDYFDCMAGAVLAHRGEVLKCIGDAVMAIFPEERIGFGIALHRGEGTYGNIGTPRRLDFTVIGGAANEAARIEALTKELGERVLVSGPVAESVSEPLRSVGRHMLRGGGAEMALFGLPSDGSEEGEADAETGQ